MKAEKIIFGTECEITGKTGNSVSDNIYFKAISDYAITSEIALQLQSKKGYHPMGYGFYGFKYGRTSEGKFTASWHCSACCD